MINFFKSTKRQLTIIIFLTFLAYSNSLTNGFAIDDHLFVVDWQLTKDLGNIPRMFTSEFAPGLGEHNGIYRPLRTLFYALSYHLWGVNPWGYHLQALIVHLIITILVYFISLRIFSSNVAMKQSNNLLAFLTALIFGLHPIHTEAISYITASFDSIAYIFFFASFFLYLKGSKPLLSLILAGIAFFTLEMTIILPVLILAYEFCFKGKLAKSSAPYFILAGFYLFVRVGLLNITSRGEYLGGSVYITFITMVQAWANYIWLLLFPINLSINPTISEGINSWVGEASKMDIILSQSIFDIRVLGSLGILGGLGWLGIKLRKKAPIVTFSLAWFFICLLPVSYIIPQGPIMQERYVYLASFGFCLLAGWGLTRLVQSAKFKVQSFSVFLILTFCLLIFFGVRTYNRNEDWKTGASIWFSLLKQTPNEPYVNLVVGSYYEQRKDYLQAHKYYENAWKNNPNYLPAYQKLLEVNSRLEKNSQ